MRSVQRSLALPVDFHVCGLDLATHGESGNKIPFRMVSIVTKIKLQKGQNIMAANKFQLYTSWLRADLIIMSSVVLISYEAYHSISYQEQYEAISRETRTFTICPYSKLIPTIWGG